MESTLTEGALTEAIYRLLRYSWEPIEYKYDALTSEEKGCITSEQFAELVKRVTDALGNVEALETLLQGDIGGCHYAHR